MDIDRSAAEVQRLANDRFATETDGVSRLQWKAIADRIAEDVFGDDWEWITSEEVGGKVTFIVTAYQHAPAR